MAKYDPIHQFLEGSAAPEVTLSFRQVEVLIGEPLPPSARAHRPWWANDRKHVQAVSWLDAGFETTSVDIERNAVVFARVERGA